MEISRAAGDVQYFPAIQFVHMDYLGVSLYVPTLHVTHEPPLGPAYPILQIHAVDVLLPVGENESGGHDVHAVISRAAVDVEYFPAIELVHMEDPGVSLYFPTPPGGVLKTE